MIKNIFLFTSLLIMTFSCVGTKESQYHSIPFEEQLRTNVDIDLPEVKIVENLQDLTDLYTKLQDPKYPRSAPIPYFDNENESMILLKPQLKNHPNGDIEIIDVLMTGSEVTINYKEIENWEYAEKNQSHPILIIKINKVAKKVNLNLIKSNNT